MWKCLDAHLGQIVCDKDGVVNWCIVKVEMPLSRFEGCVDTSIHRLEDYIKKNKERLITANRNNRNNTKNNRITITRKQKWEEQQLYRHFKRQTSEILTEKSWTWLRKGNLLRETESLLIAAQNNAIRTQYIKAEIDESQQNSKCRFCGDWDETINHICECSKL